VKSFFYLLLAMFAAITACFADERTSPELRDAILLGRMADHFLDRSGELDIDAVAGDSQGITFTPANGRVPSYGVRPTPNAAVWMRVQIPNLNTHETPWTLYLNVARIRSAQLYIPNQSGWTSLNWSYEGNPLGATGRLRFPAFHVGADEISDRVVYFRFETPGSMRGLLWLSPQSQFLIDHADESLWFGILFGITLALFAYTLAMGLALGEGSLIAVAVLTLTFFLYVFGDRGFFETSVFPGATTWSRLLSYSGVFAIYASWLMFELLYLRASDHFPRLARMYQFLVALCALLAVWAAVEIVVDNFVLRKLIAPIGLAVMILQFLLAATLVRKEQRRALAFLLCWTPAIIGGAGRLFADIFPAMGAHPLLLNMTYLGPLLSIFLFAILASLDIQLRERLLRSAVELSQQRFRSFADSASDSFWETDREGFVTYRSGPTSVAVGLGLGEQLIGALRNSVAPSGKLALQTIENSILQQKPFRGVRMEISAAQGSPRHVAFSGSPVIEPDAGFFGYRGIAADITEDIRRLDKDAQQQHMAAIGQLAGGIAHEINNLLHPIINLSKRVAAQFKASDERKGYLDIVTEAGVRASEIVSGVLASVRPTLGPTKTLPLSDAVRQAVDAIRPILPEAIVLETQIVASGGPVLSFGEVFQVLSNVVANAAHATGGSGHILVSLLEEESNNRHPGYILAIRDDGEGMSVDTRKRALEPFFTTKDIGKGTGLGLSIVYGIVRGWGATIDVESELGQGTAIIINIPFESAQR
jgi:PAS domain S-box-containing protein